MSNNKELVALVGGGSIGISYLAQLIDGAEEQSIHGRFDVLLFEPAEIVGPGDPYQEDFACNLLNTRADTMSAKRSAKDDFLNWLKENEDHWRQDYPNVKLSDDAFLPRGLFGRYLIDTYKKACEKAQALGIKIMHIQDKVTDVLMIGENKHCIDTENKGGFIVDRVILSFGNLPSNKFKHLDGKPGYFNSPYPCKKVSKNIPKDATVGVIGCGLSAIDAVLSLKASGHTGNIICMSRNGRMPSVRSSLCRGHKLEVMTKENIDLAAEKNDGFLTLELVAELLMQEYEFKVGKSCDISEVLNEHSGMHDYLSREIDLSSKESRDWQSIIYSTNSIIDYVWHKLSVKEKHRFNRLFKSLWSSYRVSFPLENAIKIRKLLSTDEVRIFAGVDSVAYDEKEKNFLIGTQAKGRSLRSIIHVDYIVNATSFSLDVAKSELPLVRNLLKRGHAVADEFGGFVVDYDSGALVNNGGEINQKITVLGSLSAGTYFWTNAMDVNARLANKQANILISTLKEKQLLTSKVDKVNQSSWDEIEDSAFSLAVGYV